MKNLTSLVKNKQKILPTMRCNQKHVNLIIFGFVFVIPILLWFRFYSFTSIQDNEVKIIVVNAVVDEVIVDEVLRREVEIDYDVLLKPFWRIDDGVVMENNIWVDNSDNIINVVEEDDDNGNENKHVSIIVNDPNYIFVIVNYLLLKIKAIFN